MRTISSGENRIFRVCEQLTHKKYRDKLGMYLIEGAHLLDEAVNNGAEIKTVLARQDYGGSFYGSDDKVFYLSDRLFDRLSQTETSQGVIAAVKKPEFSQEEFTDKNDCSNYVVLDRLQDPGNIGTIIRTADAAGYGLIIAMKGTADVFSPKAVRAATGSLFRLPVVFMDSVDELMEFTRAAGKKLAATCFDTDRYYYDEDLRENIALIIGNEGGGISRELMESSDLKIKIPMQGDIESLNASVAAGILMYEAVRPRNIR